MFSMFVYWKNQQNIERAGKSDTTSHQTKTITSINSNSLVFSLTKQWERVGKSHNQTQITFVFSVHSNQTMLKEKTEDNKQIRTKIILTHWLVIEKILGKKKTQFSSNFKLNKRFLVISAKTNKKKTTKFWTELRKLERNLWVTIFFFLTLQNIIILLM